MVLPVRFVQTEYWNTGTSGSIGGTGVNTEVAGTLDSIFPTGVSDYVGQPTGHRFQKIVVENTGTIATDNINNLKVFFNDLKFSDQLEFAFSTGTAANDTGDHPTGYPAGYDSTNFSTPIGISNAVLSPATGLNTGESLGIWLHQIIPPGLVAETGASATLGLIGETG